MKNSTQKRIETYCGIAFRSLNSNLDEFQNNKDDMDLIRGITRVYYDLVHCLSIPSGFISKNALEKKQNDPTWNVCRDHCYSPQFIGRMIMDNPDTYLNHYEKFREIFYVSCTTIELLSEENRDLSFLTMNKKGDFRILVPTNQKYQHLGIELLKRNTGRKWYNKPTSPVSNLIDTPQEILDYEKQFLVES